MTQREAALAGRITPEMAQAAGREGLAPEVIRDGLARGTLVVPANPAHRSLQPVAIGTGVRVKINANIGTSPHDVNLEKEQAKLAAALEYGADAVMDLSTGGDLDAIRTMLLDRCPAPFGTVPIYQLMTEAQSLEDIKGDDLLEMVRHHARQGVDFVTVHCGVTRAALPLLKKGSPGWFPGAGPSSPPGCAAIGRENPLYENYDRLLAIAREYDVTLSLGDGLRPGCLADATDRAQLHELKVLGELTKRAWAQGVQVMVEGPGHLPLPRFRKTSASSRNTAATPPFTSWGRWSPTWLRATTTSPGPSAGPWPPPMAPRSCATSPRRTPETAGGGGRHRRRGGLPHRRPRCGYRPGPPRRRRLGPGHVQGPPGPGLGHPNQALHQPHQGPALPGAEPAKEDQCTMCGRFCAMKVFDDKFEG